MPQKSPTAPTAAHATEKKRSLKTSNASPRKKLLITGSAGLIGSESVRFFAEKDFDVIGVDNDMRHYFFGKDASTTWNRKLLQKKYKNYAHINADIRDEKKMASLFKKHHFDLIIHTAAQPSHDWAAKEPLTDFTVNANGTLILLENFRKYSPDAVFIFTSTNKVYGDTPNVLPLVEKETRYELPKNHKYFKGIDESMSIDNSKHSVFGSSKVAADIMVQEYGKYFGLNTAVFRGGCLTGPSHSGAELHGFLAYLIKCIATGKKYTIFGYKGKQVRDNIHSYDLVNAFYHVYKKPRQGEAYNMGGARQSNISMLEAITKIEKILGKKAVYEYSDTARAGDHIWYVSDVSKFKSHYPDWDFTYDIDAILAEMCAQGHFV
jgi:CDP-paratose 2-epimerase